MPNALNDSISTPQRPAAAPWGLWAPGAGAAAGSVMAAPAAPTIKKVVDKCCCWEMLESAAVMVDWEALHLTDTADLGCLGLHSLLAKTFCVAQLLQQETIKSLCELNIVSGSSSMVVYVLGCQAVSESSFHP